MADPDDLPPAPGAVTRSRRRRLAGLAAGLLVAAFLVLGVIDGWSRVSAYSWQFDALALVGAVVLVFAYLLVTGLGYVLILERLAGRRLERRRLFDVWTRSLLGRYVPGNVLMVAGRVVLGREAGVSGRVSLAASVYEQAFILGVSGITALGFLLGVGDLGEGWWVWAVCVIPLGLVVLHPRVFGPLSGAALRRVRREPLEVFLSGRQVAGFVAWFGVANALLGLGVWALVHAFAGSQAGGPLLVGSGFLLSFVVSMLAFVFPSGLGVREGIFALTLSQDLPGGVAIAVAAGVRLGLTAIELLFVGTVLLVERSGRRPPLRSPTPGSRPTS